MQKHCFRGLNEGIRLNFGDIHNMNLDQNAVSLQPAKFYAIPTLLPRWPPTGTPL